MYPIGSGSSSGCSNQGIADKLVITLLALEKHVSSIFGKLQAVLLAKATRGGSRGTALLPGLLERGVAQSAKNSSPKTAGHRLLRSACGCEAVAQTARAGPALAG